MMKMKVLVLLLCILLLSSVLSVPVTGNTDGYVDTSYPPDNGTEDFYFDINSEGSVVKLEDFGFADTDIIFSEIEIAVQGTEPEPNDTNGFADGIQSYEQFYIEVDQEEKRFSIKQEGSHRVWVNMTLDNSEIDTWKGGSKLTLNLDSTYLNMDWTSSTDFKMSSGGKDTVLTYQLNDGGSIRSQISENSQFGGGNVLTDISVDKNGDIGGGKGVSTEVKRVKRGNIEMTIDGDYKESKIVHLNLSRELIASQINDLEEIKVSIDDVKVPYSKPRKLHTTDEQGYYVNITDGHVHVYLRMHFSTHTVKIYEDIQNDPPASASVMGLLIGSLVVVVAAAALFRKKRR